MKRLIKILAQVAWLKVKNHALRLKLFFASVLLKNANYRREVLEGEKRDAKWRREHPVISLAACQSDDKGKAIPIKTRVAAENPLLSRRERRTLVRDTAKFRRELERQQVGGRVKSLAPAVAAPFALNLRCFVYPV